MDPKEAYTYLQIAQDQLSDAELAFKNERYALCVFLAASSAENATSAWLIALGAQPSKKHRNSLVLKKLAESSSVELKASLIEAIKSMQELEPHITKARYPIRRDLELLPPSKFYTKEKAEESLARAEYVVKLVQRKIKME
ncbi:MAG: HEPN domain-containing protein [Halobacteria archaeon]